MKRISTLLFIIAAFLLLPAANDPPPTIATAEVEAELSAAFNARLESDTALQALPADLFTPEIDTAFISPDGQTAVIWVALRDGTGRILGTEPGLLLATRTDSGWQVLLPGDASWDQTMATLPEGMLPAEQSPMLQTDFYFAQCGATSLDWLLPALGGWYNSLAGRVHHSFSTN